MRAFARAFVRMHLHLHTCACACAHLVRAFFRVWRAVVLQCVLPYDSFACVLAMRGCTCIPFKCLHACVDAGDVHDGNASGQVPMLGHGPCYRAMDTGHAYALGRLSCSLLVDCMLYVKQPGEPYVKPPGDCMLSRQGHRMSSSQWGIVCQATSGGPYVRRPVRVTSGQGAQVPLCCMLHCVPSCCTCVSMRRVRRKCLSGLQVQSLSSVGTEWCRRS